MVFFLELVILIGGTTCFAAANIILVTQQIMKWFKRKQQHKPSFARKYRPRCQDTVGYLYY
jgi:hypothetical protein